MIEFLNLFVQHPLRLLGLAIAYVGAWGVVRASGRARNALLVPACFCLLFAVWEWIVTTRSPEANIRVDLLVIWPLLGLVTIWGLWQTFKRR